VADDVKRCIIGLMSGHSKWATIHRQKGVKDAARGQLFSKLARIITIATKTGGGANPDSNNKLRVAIEKARQANMPKENIERAVSKGATGDAMEEVAYEGFGPLGIQLIIEASTDNRNRSAQEIKNLLEKSGGHLGGPGSASFNFIPSGYILVEKNANPEEAILKFMDFEVEDVLDTPEGIEVYTNPHQLYDVRHKIEALGYIVKDTELIQKPKLMQDIDSASVEKVIDFLTNLEDHDDIHKVFTNAHLK